jgi:hypothetical protein
MSVKYYSAGQVKANELQGTLERVCRFNGYTELPHNMTYGYNMTNAIEIFQGDSRIVRVYVKDQDMNVINLNGATAKLYVADTSKATQYLIRKSTAVIGEGAITDPVHGEVSLYLKSTDTASLPAGQYFYLVQVYLSTGDKYTVLKGLINVSTDVGVSPLPPPDPSTGVNIVDLDIGVSSHLVVFDSASLIIGASLVAPSALSDNNFVTNITYTVDTATIYFSTSIQEAGWKLSYLIVST